MEIGHMAGILNYGTVTFDKNGMSPLIKVTGNADTLVATRYFWLPVSNSTAARVDDRADDEPLQFDLKLLGAGQNHLGFVFNATPLARAEKSLVVTFEARQGDRIVASQIYHLAASDDPDNPTQQADGITIAAA